MNAFWLTKQLTQTPDIVRFFIYGALNKPFPVQKLNH